MVPRIVCILFFIGFASAATFIANLPMKPREHAHKVGCYIEEINDVIPFGEMVTPIGVCYRVECTRRMISYASCGQIYTESKNCFVTDVDLSRPYPGCCSEIKCEQDNYLV